MDTGEQLIVLAMVHLFGPPGFHAGSPFWALDTFQPLLLRSVLKSCPGIASSHVQGQKGMCRPLIKTRCEGSWTGKLLMKKTVVYSPPLGDDGARTAELL